MCKRVTKINKNKITKHSMTKLLNKLEFVQTVLFFIQFNKLINVICPYVDIIIYV